MVSVGRTGLPIVRIQKWFPVFSRIIPMQKAFLWTVTELPLSLHRPTYSTNWMICARWEGRGFWQTPRMKLVHPQKDLLRNPDMDIPPRWEGRWEGLRLSIVRPLFVGTRCYHNFVSRAQREEKTPLCGRFSLLVVCQGGCTERKRETSVYDHMSNVCFSLWLPGNILILTPKLRDFDSSYFLNQKHQPFMNL